MTAGPVALLGEALAAVPGDEERFRAACARVDEWEEFLETARAHGVDPLLHHYAERAGVPVPPAVEEQMRRWAFMRGVTSKLALESARAILASMEAAGVHVAPLKGGLLAVRLYPSPALRPSTDVDLLIREHDVERAFEVLREAGLEPTDDAARAAYLRRHHYHLSAATPDRTTYVELHFHAHRAWGGLLSAEEMLERSRVTELVDGISVRLLEPEDELHYLAVHYAKHYELNYRLLYDMKLFVARYDAIDWGVLLARARAAGTRRALGVALRDLHRFFGVPPPFPGAALRPGPRLAALEGIRRVAAARAWPQEVRTTLEVTAGVVVADSLPKAVRWLVESGGRIARRRLKRAFPRAAPDAWAG